MSTDLQSYIETSILPTVGVVESDSEPITTLDSMLNWIRSNLRVELPEITPQSLADYLLLENETIIPKRRNFYLNTADFYDLELPLLGGNTQENEYKEVFTVLIMPDAFCKSNEFYYCSCDEWMILTTK